MKKWLVAVLGIFMMLGAGLFSACTNESAKLTLSHESVSVEVHSTEAGRDEAIVTAEVLGTSNFSLTASADGYEDFITVSTQPISATKTNIIIKGSSENDSPSVVCIKVAPGGIKKYIYVDVYSEVKSISQDKTPEATRKNFLVKGKTTDLEELPLLSLQPAKARRNITWSFDGIYENVELNGANISIGEDFVGEEIKLLATSSNGVVSEPIKIPVLDKIDEEVDLLWSYSKNSAFDTISIGNNTFNIVPNISTDENYNGFVAVNYVGDLSISGYAVDASGNETDLVVVNGNGSYSDLPLFKVSTKQGVSNFNGEYKIGFKIGYAKYDYEFDTINTYPINIKVREKVNDITISSEQVADLEGSTQTLYTQYANSASSSSYGQEFNVSITPTTVIDATNKYAIILTRNQAGAAVSTGCPVEFYYRDSLNGNRWIQIAMEEQSNGSYTISGGEYISASTIYMKASQSITQQVVEGFSVAFQSFDNPIISTSFNLRLVKAVSAIDFSAEEGEFRIDSSENEGNVVRKKQFTLEGQTSIDGLYIENNSEYVNLSLQYLTNTEDSVTFEVVLTLKPAGYGVTSFDSYRIAHQNGVSSEEMKIDIFLPLKDAAASINKGADLSNSVTDEEYNADTYLLNGVKTSSTTVGLSSLMLKNDTTTPIYYSFNSVNGYFADADIKVGFVDFEESVSLSLEDFKDSINTDEGVASIIAYAQDNINKGSTSKIAYFTDNSHNLITKGVGYTYAVMFFTGKGVDNIDEQGNVTIVRIVLIESYVSPSSMSLVPESDRDITLYSLDSLASSDQELTRKTVRIKFAIPEVTYTDITNIEFKNSNGLMGSQSRPGNNAIWSNGRYSVSNIAINKDGISFNIEVIGTFGELAFYDTLEVHYVLRNNDYEKVLDIFVPIEITIKNAQRVEKLTWKNSSEEGLYFKVRDLNPQYIMLETLPANSRNDSIHYVKTTDDGQFVGRLDEFVSVNPVSSDILALNLSADMTSGMNGYIYLMPADAVYNNQIKYYYLQDGQEKSGSIGDSLLGSLKEGEETTYYDFLVNQAYFKSNATDSDEIKNISFAEILVKIKVNIADGKSFEHAYRIFDNEAFKGINPELYYTVMNSLDLSGETLTQIQSFKGGLQGADEAVSIKFNQNFAFINEVAAGAEIRNLTFIGKVADSGFVANTNNGTLSNITIDVNGVNPSVLNVNGVYGGGIVGVNNNKIIAANVLGLEIKGPGAIIGGIAGRNFGKIESSRVEFYNLEVEGQTNTYSANKFSGNVVGAFVGKIESGSTIYKTYAYNYTDFTSVLDAATFAGAFAGEVDLGAAKSNTTIDYSFSFVEKITPFRGYIQNNQNVALTNYYIAYTDGTTGEHEVIYVEGYESNSNFINKGKAGFESYVNGENEYHLRDLMQEEGVESVDYSIQTTNDRNGYFKSLAVPTQEGAVEKGILFAYDVANGAKDLTSAEKNDLNALNTISLATLVNDTSVNKNIIITSSNTSVIKVVGSSLNILKPGTTTLRLSSKQDVEKNKPIEVTVVYAVSEIEISWITVSETINYVRENSILTLQKTRSRDLFVEYENTNVYLGPTANSYQLKLNEQELNIKASVESGEKVVVESTSKNSFKITANENSQLTNLEISPKIFADEVLQNAIDLRFSRKFAVQPYDGVISFGVSGQELSITPSVKTVVKVEIKTTDSQDSVVPIISFKDNALRIQTEGANKFKYLLPRDIQANKAVLSAVVEKVDTSSKNGVYTIVYNVTFSVHEDYKAGIAEDMDFVVYFESTSGNSSKQWNGIFNLSVTKQNFTSIDVQTRRVEYSVFKNAGGNPVEVHKANDLTAVLAPGNSAIMQININPEFAYYDYVDFSYSFGEQIVLDAVNIEVVEPFDDNNASTDDTGLFVRRKVDASIEEFSSSLRFIPTSAEKERGAIYFKVWVNTTVEKDSTITFTASFKDRTGKESFVKSYLTISYLTQPVVTVDGNDTAYLAKGASAKVRIDVLPDQVVDSLIIDGTDIQGISVSALSAPNDEEAESKGIRTYTATISSTVLAKAENDMFSILARVSRELNGNKEEKTSVATVILVDFKIDHDNISLVGANEDNFTVWQGVPKTLSFQYNLLPESYNVASDIDSQEELQKLKAAREQFLTKEFYPAEENADNARYLINYVYDKTGNLRYNDENSNGQRDEWEKPKPESLKDRLFYYFGNERRSINDLSVDSPVRFVFDPAANQMSVIGTKISGSIDIVLVTYVSAGGYTAEYEKHFTITVRPHSSEDLPTTISNAHEFEMLNPEGQNTAESGDFILTNDIVLENYTPFDTSLIRSLDGNGYTIYIKSFNTNPQDTKTLNLALFNRVVKHNIDEKEIPTILKNVRVNLYNGGQITVDTNKYQTINIAGLAIENNGIITNCEVVSFYSEGNAMGQVLAEVACIRHSNPTGINVNYVFGANTTQKEYHDGYKNWTSQIAGFVVANNGNITNSRVGGDSIIVLDGEKVIDGQPTSYTYASHKKLDTFHIIGQGNMAGFVLANNGGHIAASFAKNIDMYNQSKSTSFYVAGFVGTNTSSIRTSYVEGVETDEELINDEKGSVYANEGSSIKSDMGIISGFIYNNTGIIKDSYSNILIANIIQENQVYLASGFVYRNEGTLENCYSASQIQESNFTQLNFSGVDSNGNLLTSGNYVNCYFFDKAYETREEANDTTTESTYSTGALLVSNPAAKAFFYGFAIADGESDGIWRMDAEKGIKLIEANDISISHRYVLRITDENFEGEAAEDEQGKYLLPYATLTFVSSSLEINTSLGGVYNPILVVDAQDWLEITGLSTSKYEKEYFNENAIWGTYRIVNNIDLADIASSDSSVILPSSRKAFAGTLYGNGFQISGISITSDSRDVAFGIFKSIEPIGNSSPIITNIDFKIEQVVAGDTAMVGALAGFIKDAKLINIELALNEGSQITGLNFVGSLTGLAFGNNIIKNINVENPSITADRYSNETVNDYFKSTDLKDFRVNLKNNLNYNSAPNSSFFNSIGDYSYAGGVIGFADNFVVESPEFAYDKDETYYSINNIRVNGVAKIQGQVAGGAFGLLGYQTNISDVGLTISGSSATNSSYILATKHFAGGIAGQSFGSISRTFASHQQNVQDQIENNMASYYNGNHSVERGILNLFSSTEANYTQKYIGGIVGYAGSGNIEIAYSRLNVTSANADFAGGIIGGTELEDASSYHANATLSAAAVFTKFFLNEVYATGDVRAKESAGGIIGVIKGESSRVAMFAVNAFNYFASYDYETNKDVSLNQGQQYLSNNFKVYALVGRFINNSGEKVVINNNTGYLVYLQTVKGQEVREGEPADETQVPSVAVYEHYNFEGQKVAMDLFEIDSSLRDNLDIDSIYQITGPDQYSDATEGHSYTQEGFLNSGAWTLVNWSHPLNELFPSIRYKRNTDVLYLDCYNVEYVFEKMSQSDVRVVVRGETSKGSEEYAHINVDAKNINKIQEYKGRIQGAIYKTTDSGEDVRIVATGNFIESTGEGFYVDKLTVEYNNGDEGNISLDGYVNGASGLFVNREISESTISGLKLIINTPIEVSSLNASGHNIGLVAPSIKSTSIKDLEIISELGSSDSIISISNGPSSREPQAQSTVLTQLNVGLVAGKVVQESRLNIMMIEDVEVKSKSNLISVSGTSYNDYNIGGFIGITQKGSGVQDLRINISQLTKETKTSTEDPFTKIMLTNVNQNQTAEKVGVYLGGFIGNSSNVGKITTMDDSTINTNIYFAITGSSKIDKLHIGGVLGKHLGSALDIVGESSILENIVQIENRATIEDSYIGSFAGLISAPIKLSGFETINLTIKNSNYNHNAPLDSKLNQEAFVNNEGSPIDYMNNEGAPIATGNGYVGIVVGYSEAKFTFNANTSSTTSLNEGKQPIKLSSNSKDATVYFGSVLGGTNAVSTDENTSTSITGNIISNAQVAVEGKGSAILGGMIGEVFASNGSKVEMTENPSKLRFDGAFYTNVNSAIVSGVLGKYYSSSNSNLLIQRTSFGGALKVYGNNSNDGSVTFGGTVGVIDANGSDLTSNVKLINNYNYGDVFSEFNDNFSEIEIYRFGGLVGFMTSNLQYNVSQNYTLTTSHNARNSNTLVNALFGEGAPQQSLQNYYSHAVVLANDLNGHDAGYNAGYQSSEVGYNVDKKPSSSICLTEKIRSFLNINQTDLYAGHKLNPSNYDSNVKLNSGASQFNGITYFTVNQDLTNNSIGLYTLTNVALIGNGNTIEYIIQDTAEEGSEKVGLAKALSGYSFISGFAVNADVVIENAGDNDYGTVVGTMSDNSILYAINVYGTMEIGGPTTSRASGLVGKISSGKIFDCSTDLDIVYRAGSNGKISAITSAGEGNVLIDNTYAAGSLKTMVDANVYAFANTQKTTTINDCYTITKIDLNDYTQAKYIPADDKVKISNGEYDQLFFDIDGLNYAWGKVLPVGAKNFTELKNRFNGNYWVSDNNFNYGYPTLKYQHLKRSSYATIEETEQGAEGYDENIINATYTRRPNGSTPSTNDFFMIPNVAVLSNMAKIAGMPTSQDDSQLESSTIIGNFALLYDIDWNNRIDDKSQGYSNTKAFSGHFDGRGKTIRGLKSGLFEKIEKVEGDYVWVRNLRLTDANLSAETSGLLAKEIVGATISNMTLSGFLSHNSSGGALANSASSANINTITNMVKIDIAVNSSETEFSVGGIVGTMRNTTMSYCSNYGPINAIANSKNSTINVGGLVGSVANTDDKTSTINNSYNATSVLNNYATSTVFATTTGTFNAGGIVGKASGLSISQCYNSGMIKSGNKSNGTTDDKTGTINGVAFAGGIIGYGVSGITIDTFYNEGTVEARGANPTFVWAWETLSGNIMSLTLRQNSKRNVHAYAAGYIEAGSMQSANVRLLRPNANSKEDKSIYNNGSYNEQETLMQSWAWTEIKKTLTQNQTVSKRGRSFYWGWYTLPLYFYHFRQIDYSITVQTPKESDKPNVVVTALDELSIPRAFVLVTSLNVELKVQDEKLVEYGVIPFGFIFDSGFSQDPQTKDGTINEAYTGSVTSNIYYKKFLENAGNKLSNLPASEANYNEVSSNLVANSRSSKGEPENIKTIKVAGDSYYIADQDNLNSIFNAGIYQTSTTIQTENLPYFNNLTRYKISNATVGGQSVGATITKVSKVKESEEKELVELTMIVQSTNPINGKFSATISVDYQEEITFDTSSLSYEYVDNYSIGINSFDTFTEGNNLLNGYTLITGGGVSYDKVIMLSTTSGRSSDPSGQPDFADENLRFFAVSENLCVYIPNATLKAKATDETYEVNRFGGMPEDLTEGAGFISNVQSVINTIAGKTFYIRSEAEETFMKDISFTDSGTGAINFTTPADSNNDIEFEYGKVVSPTINILIEDFNLADGSKTKRFKVQLTGVNEDFIGMDGETAILSYDYEIGKYETAGNLSNNSQAISGGVAYTIKVEDDGIAFETDKAKEILDIIIADIESSVRAEIEAGRDDIATEIFAENAESLEATIRSEVEENPGEMTAEEIEIEIQNRLNVAIELLVDEEIEKRVADEMQQKESEINDKFNQETKIMQTFILSRFNLNYIANKKPAAEEIEINLPDFIGFESSQWELSDSTLSSTLETTTSIGSGVGDLKASIEITSKITSNGLNVKLNGDGTKVVVSAANEDGIIKYNLGSVTIKQGSILGAVTIKDYQAKVEGYSIKNSSGGKAYLDVKLHNAGNETQGIQGLYPQGLNQANSLGETLTGEIKLEGKIYSTYVLNEYDADNFQVALSQDGKGYLVAGEIQTNAANTNVSTSITSVSQIVVRNDKKNTLVTEIQSLVKDNNDVEHLVREYQINDTSIFKITYSGANIESGIESYTIYFDSEGTLLTQEITDPDDSSKKIEVMGNNVSSLQDNKIYYKNSYTESGGTTYSINSSDIAETINSNVFKNFVIGNATENDDGTIKERYLYIDLPYTKTSEIEFYYGSEARSQVSQIERKKFEWIEKTSPSYSVLEQNCGFDSYNWKFATTSEGISSNVAKIDTQNGNVSLILKPAATTSYSIGFSIEGEIVPEAEGLEATETKEAYSIIIEQDLSFFSGVGFSKAENLNIIGNGYYIAYYGASFYNSIYSGFINDVSFLGVTYNQTLMTASADKVKLCNIYLYGSVIDQENAPALIADANNSTIDGLKTYVAVNGAGENGVVLLGRVALETHDEISSATNYGLITAIRGTNGANGANANNIGSSGKDGTAGGSGASIKATEGASSMINKGILYAGDGGNGGAGGSDRRGADDSKNNLSGGRTSKTVGGAAGAAGSVTGFDEETVNLASVGIAGFDGLVSRNGFGKLTMSNVNGVYSHNSFAWVTTGGQEKDVSNASAIDIYGYLFGSGDQEPPKEAGKE